MKSSLKIRHVIVGFVITITFYHFLSYFSGNPNLFPSLKSIINHSLPEIGLMHVDCINPSYKYAILVITSNLLITLRRILIGSTIGVILGVLAGFYFHINNRFKIGNKVILFILKGIPIFALIPLFLFWTGGGELGSIAYISFSVFILIAITAYESSRSMPTNYSNFKIIYGLSKYQYFKHIVIYYMIAEIFATLRNISGLVFAFALGTEMFGGSDGLGNLVYYAFIHGSMGKLYIYSSIYIFLGILVFVFINYFNNLVNWSKNEKD
jgi:ABC-type nitrate/sulfonate/bicarbonate transport system permease component